MPLTDTFLRSAKPSEKPTRVFDGGGLYVEISPAGGKLWRLKYRYGGKEKLLALGRYPEVSLKEARERRDEARKLLANEVDPAENRKAIKAAKLDQAANSFEAVCRAWYAKAYADKAESTREKTMTRLEQDVFPFIGSMPVASITAGDVRGVIERIEKRRALDIAKRVFNYIGRTLRYADSLGMVERDVSGSIDLALLLPQRKTKHHAALIDPVAVGGLMRAIEGFIGSYVTVRALRLAPLTFVRPGELRHAEWSEIDLDGATWTVPAGRMKMKLEHVVPLSTQAVAILRELHAVTGVGTNPRYVFPSERGGSRPMSENTLNAALRRMGYTKEEMTSHGFRAMARTMLDEVLGFRPDFIEHQLAHAVKDANGRAYNRTKFLAERREMMQAWADYLDGLKDG